MSLTALDIADNRYPLPLCGSGIFYEETEEFEWKIQYMVMYVCRVQTKMKTGR